MRELNEGVGKIYDEMEAAGLPEPEYSMPNKLSVKFTLRNDIEHRIPRLQSDTLSSGDRVNDSVNDRVSKESRELAILRVLADSPSATAADIGAVLGFSESKVRRLFRR